ncbi:MAG: choice-of-anchor D domain-containing protein [Verrucomicrobiae bacterium]|nr:choice-of-anchor D domain-containing protein [Verrucomicrobiae bacterium]
MKITLISSLICFAFLSADHCAGQSANQTPLLSRLAEPLILSPSEIEAYSVPGIENREARDESVSGFTIDRQNRNSVVAAYHRYYRTCDTYVSNHEWTGNVKLCDAGTVSAPFQDDTLRRINWFRAQAGLPADISFDSTKNTKCQAAALMMSRNDDLSHYPPSSWLCFTADGAEAAAASNISLGNFGPGSVNSQMMDDGTNNAAAGHRRWLLYSRAQEMGSGSIPPNDQGYPPTACTWVVGEFKPEATTGFVAWPNDGFVPCDVVPNESQQFPRWSFSYPGANFDNATVTVSRGPVSLPVTLEEIATGAGDNTIVWRPVGVPATDVSQDTVYSVQISDVKGAPQSTFRYNVTLIDPFRLTSEPVITGPTNPSIGIGSRYNFTSTGDADAYRVSTASPISGTWIEGAESLGETIVDETSYSYALQTSAIAATGMNAFHLTFPNIDEITQDFVINRAIVPSGNSYLSFKNRFRFVTDETALIAEISQDEGASWRAIWTRTGDAASSGSSADWETVWRTENVLIPDRYSGRSVNIRFRLARLDVTSRIFVGTSESVGAFVDDVQVTSSTELLESGLMDLPATATGFNFTPTEERTYVFRVRPQVGTHWFGYSPVFTVNPTSSAPSPLINSVSPGTGTTGSLVTLIGENFSSVASQNIVRFGDAEAVVTSSSATRVTVLVPGGLFGAVHITLSVGGRDSNPVTFQIPGSPKISITPDILTFRETLVRQSQKLTLQIRNEGTDTLAITNIVSSDSTFSVESSVPFSLAPAALQEIVIVFSPLSLGDHSATLKISSNDRNSPTVNLTLTGTAVSKQVVYQTDFSQFAEGLNTIDGVDGWSAIHPGDGVQGTIDTTLAPDIGRSAFIGFNKPSDDFNGIFRRFGRDPIAEGNPLIEFSIDLAIFDSTNSFYDIFSFRIHNIENDLLATVTLDNRNLQIYTWNGIEFRDTDKKFENDKLFTLTGRIDLASNTWSAEMHSESLASNHLPLFENIPFHSGRKQLDLGLMLLAWQLDEPENPGDNWMLIDNLSVSLIGTGIESPQTVAITRTWINQDNVFTMKWSAVSGKTYEVRFSDDLIHWFSGLPGSTFITNGEKEHTFSDSSQTSERFYRVLEK